MLPLKGRRRLAAALRAREVQRHGARASTLARVVSKWVLLGTTSPACTAEPKRMRSAARPWWVGMTCLKPVISRTAASKRKNERPPAYDSSPRCMPAHCGEDIAPVPESVSRSMSTSSARSWKGL